MMLRTVIRSAVTIGWLLAALLVERILTLGAITDISGVAQNPPLFVVIGGSLMVVAVAMAIAVLADHRSWPALSAMMSIPYVVAGIWLRLENSDDSGAAVAGLAAIIAVLSVGVRLDARSPARSSSSRPDH